MVKTSKNKLNLTYIILFFIALSAMNVMNGYYYLLLFAFAVFCVTPNRKLHMDIVSVLSLVVLGTFIFVLSPDSTSSISSVLKPFIYVFCYIMGASLMKNREDSINEMDSYKGFYWLIGALAIGALGHYFLNWVSNIGVEDITRNTVDFWTKQTLGATGQSALACMGLALAIACLFCDSGKKAKVGAWIAIIVVLAYNFILAGRTLLVMMLSLILVAFLYRRKMENTGKFRQLLLVALAIAFVIALVRFDFLGIGTYWESTPLHDRFFADEGSIDISEDGRIERKLFYLQHMFEYPFGGAHLSKEIGYAHDVFLDTYDHFGLFALFAIVVFMIHTVVHLVRCIKDNTLPFALRQIVLCVYVAMYIEFMIEPILFGTPWLFASFCLIDGYLSRVLVYNKKLKEMGKHIHDIKTLRRVC